MLSRVGGQYELTALGRALLDRTAAACDLLERIFTSQVHFDPATQEHEFTLLTSDYAVAVFGAGLARAVHAKAPGVRLRFRQTPPDIAENAAALLTTSDGLFMPHGVIGGFPAVDLFTDRWVFLVATDNPEVGDQLTMADLASLPWATYQRASDALAARQLASCGPRMTRCRCGKRCGGTRCTPTTPRTSGFGRLRPASAVCSPGAAHQVP